MIETKALVCREFVEEDQEPVKQLTERVFKDFLDGKYWDWKYKRNSDFDPSLLMVAEENGKVVGCNHWLRRNLKISDSIKIQSILGADLIVDSDHRGRGIGRSLMLFGRSRVQKIVNEGAVLRYMFADPDLSGKLYAPVAGYIPAPSTTISYFKVLGWSRLLRRIGAINEKIESERKLGQNVNLKILFRLIGAPQLLVELNHGHVRADQVSDADANVVVTSDLATLARLKGKKKRLRAMVWAMLTGKMRIKGGLFSLIRLSRTMWIIEEIFSGKVS